MEPVYQKLVETLNEYRPRIPFLRIDVGKSQFIRKYLSDHEDVPSVIGVRKGSFYKYHDHTKIERFIRFADKLYAPVKYLNDITEITQFLQTPKGNYDSVRILGVLYDSDLIKDFENAMDKICN